MTAQRCHLSACLIKVEKAVDLTTYHGLSSSRLSTESLVNTATLSDFIINILKWQDILRGTHYVNHIESTKLTAPLVVDTKAVGQTKNCH